MTMLFADLALARRLEHHEARGLADYAYTQLALEPQAQARVLRIGGGYAVFLGAGLLVNRAAGLGLTAAVSASDLERIERFYEERQAPVALELCPLADSSFLELLGRRGYGIKKFYNVYARSIFPSERLPPEAEVSVRPLNADEADLWTATVTDNPTSGPDPAIMKLAALAFNRPGVRCYLAELAGEPAGAAALYMREGLASPMFAFTRPDFRRRGVQTALLQARLAAAARAGCDLATTTTSPPGNTSQRNLQRAGFGIVYTKMVMTR
ncbi:MAG: GNAT family N-acetyltransferase [Deinococcota bacterium]|nr:GNAT family N-acetyltransferase [Deinococcota bacterium]